MRGYVVDLGGHFKAHVEVSGSLKFDQQVVVGLAVVELDLEERVLGEGRVVSAPPSTVSLPFPHHPPLVLRRVQLRHFTQRDGARCIGATGVSYAVVFLVLRHHQREEVLTRRNLQK